MIADFPHITFNIPVGTEYRTKLLNFETVSNQLHATIEVEPGVWEYIDLMMLFNLNWDRRSSGSISGTKPVQLKIVFDKDLYASLNAESKLISNKKSFLASEPKHPIRSAKNWFATEVTEGVELPESLKENGTLREGFTTKWKDEF